MATRYLPRSLLTSTQSLALMFSHSYTASAVSRASSFLYRLRPLVAVTAPSRFRCLVPGISARAFSTRQTPPSLNDQSRNWLNRPPKETILVDDGCDFKHWLVVMDPPEGDVTRDEIIDVYIKTLASVVGSEEEARMKIYSVSTRYYFAFGALVSEELSFKIEELPKVSSVLPDSYMDVKNKDYGGEPFINGQAVPYDPKYHEQWVRIDSWEQRWNRLRNFDRSINFDRSRNFDRRGGGMQGRNSGPNAGGPGGDYGGQPNMGPNAGQPHMGGPPNNPGNYPAGNNHQYGPANNAPNHQYGPGPN